MTVIEYSIGVLILGVPLGFIVGVLASILLFITTETEAKKLFMIFCGIHILVPTVIFFIVFVFMSWFSIFDPNLNMW